MRRHGADWFRERAREKWERAREKWERDAGRRSSLKNSIRRDIEELEALKVELLREARAERRKAERRKKLFGTVSNSRRASVNTVEATKTT